MPKKTIALVTLGRAEGLRLWAEADKGCAINLRLLDPRGAEVHAFSDWTSAAAGILDAALPGNIRLWSFNDPRLYRLVGEVSGLAVDQWVGFRWWSARGNRCVELNGKPVYPRGVIRGISAHDHPNLSGASDYEWHEKSIREIKRFGMNCVRWHSTIPDDSYLDAADRLGFGVHVEIGFDKRGADIVVDREKWQRLIRAMCRHPSLMIYCVGNEIRRCGTVAQVQELVAMARAMDPSALVMDNCGWGQPDRPNPDVYCQHVAYFFPHAEHAHMFDYPIGFELEGLSGDGATYHARNPMRPVLAHEVCHYIALRDLQQLRTKWMAWKKAAQPADSHEACELPWWVDGLTELYQSKGLLEEEPVLREASRAFQRLCQRHTLESIRRSPALCGFEMLQQSDCWRFENSNGLLDSFDDPLNWKPPEFKRFNADSVLLAHMPRRDFRLGQAAEIPVCLSHFGTGDLNAGTLGADVLVGDTVLAAATYKLEGCVEGGTVREVAKLDLHLPEGDCPMAAQLLLKYTGHDLIIQQNWPLWLFPRCDRPEDTRVVETMDADTLARVERGDNLLWLYRPADLFDATAKRPEFDLEGRRDLFKGVIWDRGDNLGAVIRDHPMLADLPHDGVLDWQLAPLVHHGCKVNLDDFPAKVRPVIQGVGRPVRDRMQVKKLNKTGIQPSTTFRRWGWLFELAVGKGRLIVCGFNFNMDSPAGDYLFQALVRYLDNPGEDTATCMEADVLHGYLQGKGRAARPVEGPMTQFWLRDTDPVETTLFWEELGIRLK